MLDVIRRMGFWPQQCAWELTLACNMRCQHCSSRAGEASPDELTWDECSRVADELATLGCNKVGLTGGEPTLHPRWHDLAKRLQGGGIGVHIVSNGWTWNERHVELALESKLENVGFSLDGLEADHDAVRRPGSFRRVVSAIERCTSAGIPVGVLTHLNRLNSHKLEAQRAWLQAHGVGFWQLQLGVPTGAMADHRELVLLPEDLLWLIPELARLRRASPSFVSIAENIGYYGVYEAALRDRGNAIPFWYGCRAGCRSIAIKSNGDIMGCLALPHVPDLIEGNVRDTSLVELWRRPGAFSLNRDFDESRLGGFCASCRYRDICRGGCSWTSCSMTGSYYDNPYCFYRQAVEQGRLELLGEDSPTPQELGAIEARRRAE